jgi:multidrug efflux pump subunit AcrB
MLPLLPGRAVRGATVLVAGAMLAVGCSLLGDGLLGDAGTRVLVTIPANEAEAVPGGVAVVERAVASLPGLRRLRSVGCATGGAVLLELEGNADPAAVVHGALVANKGPLPPGAGAIAIAPVDDDLVLLSVRADDVFAARAFVDASMVPALRAIPGVRDVVVSGGRLERQLRLDPERLLATDVSLPEVLATVKAASDLNKAEVKRLPGNVSIFLRDVARVELAPAGERVRKDGGIEVRVRGHHGAAGAAARAARAIAPPAGMAVAMLDDDSVEVVTVLVSRLGAGGAADGDSAAVVAANAAVDAAFADVAAAALSVPGVHTFRRSRTVSLTLDRARLVQQGLSAREISTITETAAIATTGLMVETASGPLRLVVAAVSTPEALLRTRVASRSDGTAVRLFDVARATVVDEQRRDRVDQHDARRLRLSFDAGVRQRALDELEARLAAISRAKPGVSIVVERDRDSAPLDAVCP